MAKSLPVKNFNMTAKEIMDHTCHNLKAYNSLVDDLARRHHQEIEAWMDSVARKNFPPFVYMRIKDAKDFGKLPNPILKWVNRNVEILIYPDGIREFKFQGVVVATKKFSIC